MRLSEREKRLKEAKFLDKELHEERINNAQDIVEKYYPRKKNKRD